MSERTAERLIRERIRNILRRIAEITGINLNTPYPFLAPAAGGLAGGIAGHVVGRKYEVPDYLSVPAGMLAGYVTGRTVNNMFEYPEDKRSYLRMQIMAGKHLNFMRQRYQLKKRAGYQPFFNY